jgi:transcriptional regulator with XRE-family HTH domain
MSRSSSVRKADLPEAAVDTIALIGSRIRELRRVKEMTLQSLASGTGLSLSMLSLVERGKTSPSIGTLIAISSALDVHMGDLLAPPERVPHAPVSRAEDQPVFETPEGVRRRLLRDDRQNGVEIAINDYAARSGSATVPLRHDGYEYGVVLEGELTVELDGRAHALKNGDLISYSSSRSHRIWNYTGRRARALWINLHHS